MFWCLVFRILTNSVAPGGRLGFRVAEAVVGFLALGCFETLFWLKIEGSNMNVFLYMFFFRWMRKGSWLNQWINEGCLMVCWQVMSVIFLWFLMVRFSFSQLFVMSFFTCVICFMCPNPADPILYPPDLSQIFVQWRMELPEDEGRINLMLYIPTSWAGYSQCDLPETYPQISSHDTVLCPFLGGQTSCLSCFASQDASVAFGHSCGGSQKLVQQGKWLKEAAGGSLDDLASCSMDIHGYLIS